MTDVREEPYLSIRSICILCGGGVKLHGTYEGEIGTGVQKFRGSE